MKLFSPTTESFVNTLLWPSYIASMELEPRNEWLLLRSRNFSWKYLALTIIGIVGLVVTNNPLVLLPLAFSVYQLGRELNKLYKTIHGLAIAKEKAKMD